MAVPQVTLYVDIVSPFAYIAFHVLKASDPFLCLPRELTTAMYCPQA